MTKIDTSRWQEFEISKLFDIVKGTRLTKANMKDGNNRFIGSSAMNNGLTALIDNDEKLHPANTITVCYNGSVGETFYQDEPFWASDDVNVLYPKFTMTKNIGLFIVPLIRSIGQRYAFVNKWRMDVMEKDCIKLPVDPCGCPDWAYMDSFMAKVMKESEACIENLRLADEKKTAVDISQWKEFKIGELFPKIKKPPVLHNRQVIEDKNGIPYIVRTKFDNGMKCRVQRNNEMLPSPAGVISFGAENATFFYQQEEFVSGRDIYYIDTRELSMGTCMFLTACLQPVARKYSYNYGLFPDLLKSELIKLPVDSHGQPDWAYMDAYMQTVTNESEKHIEVLSESVV